MEFSISLLNFTNDLNATLYFEGYIILDYCKYPRFFQSGKHKQWKPSEILRQFSLLHFVLFVDFENS